MSEAAIAEAPNPAETPSPAAEATPDADREEANALLEELEASKGTPADTDEGTPGDGEDTPEDEEQAAIDARAAEKAEQIAQEKLAAQEAERKAKEEKAKRKAEEDGQETAFAGRAQAIHDFCVEQGMNEEAAQRVVATFRAHNGDIAPVTQRQMQRDLIAAAGLEEFEWSDPQSFIEAVKDATKGEATKGMFTAAEVARKTADALLAQKRRYQKNPELLTAARGAADRQTGSGGGRFSDEQALHRAFNNEEIDRATYRTEYKRLTGRDLE